MRIYKALSTEIPIIGYSVIRQDKISITEKEYINQLLDIRDKLKEESRLIKSSIDNFISEILEKSAQTTRGSLSQFLTTPIQTDTDDIQRILKDYFLNTSDQINSKVLYGISGGYESKYIFDAKQGDMPKPRMLRARTYLQNSGFKFGRNTPDIFESLYFMQGSVNLDVLEYMIRNAGGVYDHAQEKKTGESSIIACSLNNLIFLDGTLELDIDKFELRIDFAKTKLPYLIFNRELGESIKFFRKEIHNLNVSVWQRKLGLGVGSEYILRIRTKDRFTLRSVISSIKRYLNDHNPISDSVNDGIWFIKELV